MGKILKQTGLTIAAEEETGSGGRGGVEDGVEDEISQSG